MKFNGSVQRKRSYSCGSAGKAAHGEVRYGITALQNDHACLLLVRCMRLTREKKKIQFGHTFSSKKVLNKKEHFWSKCFEFWIKLTAKLLLCYFKNKSWMICVSHSYAKSKCSLSKRGAKRHGSRQTLPTSTQNNFNWYFLNDYVPR